MNAARQAERRHRRLGAGGDQAELLDGGDPRADLVDELGSPWRRRAEAQAAAGGLADRLDDLGVRVAEQRRTPRADEVDVLVAVDVGDVRAARGGEEAGRAADVAEGAHGRVDAAGDDGLRARERGRARSSCPRW